MAKILSVRQRALQSRDAIELVADKWRIAILHVLTPGAVRTGDLQRALPDVSPKVLTQTLRGLERDGLILRHAFPVVPPHVEYELTDMGRSVLAPLRELCLWAKANVAGRDAARLRYDQRLVEKGGAAASRLRRAAH